MTPSFDYLHFGASRLPELDFMRSVMLRFGSGDLDRILEVEAPRRCIVLASYVRDKLGPDIRSDAQRDLLVWLRDQIAARSGSSDNPVPDLAFAPLIGENIQPKSKAAHHV